MQHQHFVEENLRNSNYVNEFNRLEGAQESENQRLIHKDSKIGRCLRWVVFLCPIIFFLICFIFCIVILSLLGQSRSAHDTTSSRAVINSLANNLNAKPLSDIQSWGATSKQEPKCNEGELLNLFRWPGARGGCYCKDDTKPRNKAYCLTSGCDFTSDHDGAFDASVETETYFCGFRAKSFYKIYDVEKEKCTSGTVLRGGRYCSSEDIISKVEFVRSNFIANVVPNTTVNASKKSRHYQAPNPTANVQVVDPNLVKSCDARVLFIKSQKIMVQQHVCPNLYRDLTSNQPVIGFQALLAQGDKVSLPCLNPSKMITVPGLSLDHRSKVKQNDSCLKYGSYDHEDFKNEIAFTPTGYSVSAKSFAESNEGFKKAFGSTLKDDHKVHIYHQRRINTPEKPECRNIDVSSLNNFTEEINTWYKTVAVLTSIALALTVIGLLICICYIALKKVRAFRKPIVYAIVYMLAFIVAILLIAQGIYYFVVRDYYSISSGYNYFQHLINFGCLPAGFRLAAIDINHYVDESIWKISPFVIFLFIWSILFIVVFLICWIIGRLKRQAICNRPF